MVALLLGGVGLFLQTSVQRDLLHSKKQQLAQEIQARVHSQIAQSQSLLKQLSAGLPLKAGQFSALLPQATSPVLIYQANQLVFWSDHMLRSDVEPHMVRQPIQILENRFGRFLVVSQRQAPDYLLVTVTPLETRYGISNSYLKNALNPALFEDHAVALQTDKSENAFVIKGTQGQYLFSLKILEPNQWLHASKFTLQLYVLAIVSWLGFVLTRKKQLQAQGKPGMALNFAVAGLLLLRMVMLLGQFPGTVQDVGLFSPRVYAAAWWSPSLGDLLLNEGLLLVLSWWVYQYAKGKRFGAHFQNQGQKQNMFSVLLALGIIVLMISWYESYRSLITNSQPILDITQNIQFNPEKLLLFLAMVLHTLAISWLLRLLLRWLPFNSDSLAPFAAAWGTVLLVALLWAFWREAPIGNWTVLLSSSLLVLWEMAHRRFLNKASIYSSVFLVNIISASLGGAALYDLYDKQLRQEKQRVAAQLLKDRDEVTEYLLAEAATAIQKDALITRTLRAPWVNQKFIDQKIRRHYLRPLTESYTVVLRMFDVNGAALMVHDSALNLETYAATRATGAKPTTQKGQLLVSSAAEPGRFTYLQEIKLLLTEGQWATVVLELSPKITTPNSVLPELLVERKSTQGNAVPASSYALWRENRLLKTEGYFEYSQTFGSALLEVPLLYTQGLTIAGYHHVATKSMDGTVAVVSTPIYGFRSWLSNFSFLFLLHTVTLFGLLAVSVLYRGELVQVITSTFSTKIQLFLNLGVLVPLVLVSLTIGSLVTDSYQQDLTRGYTEQGEFIRQNLMTNALGGRSTRPDSLVRRVNRLAALAQTEVNVYNAQGQLQIASQPALFEAGVLSTRLNPEAYSGLKERGLARMLLQEKAGELPFSTMYLPLRKAGEVSPSGFLAIPYFDSQKELNNKLIQLITTILNIFTVLFLVFVLLSYLATRALTVPLQLLTERLKKTTLTGNNEKLVYESRDEIGLLVREYNQMLQKLEESKQELALREKEAAWKEMARQVAHEIKNPLTPMKLSLQYLRKAMQEGRSNLEELVEKISKTMITQIDVLSDIATSFSNFTSMPDLKLETLELNDLIKRAADLHINSQQHQVQLNLPQTPIHVRADENQLIRVFNNLLLNALQAVPSSRTPEITIDVTNLEPDWVVAAISDNGSGIPEDVQPKIFMPNFSTKYTGSGIGLAVVKKAVEAIGGTIWFETKDQEGTTFFLKLPVQPS
ncbi:HAMP domain-containing sensor histidine kinase [Rufibacter sp. LB8]|uniref:sensor histidine kinase n=1 Tax=Rufibacter sp. LB8 TaxID=2777781 RepID=UPI00178C5713